MIVFNEVMYILCRLFKTEYSINITVIYKNFSFSTKFSFYCNEFALISEIVSVGFSPVTAFRSMPSEKFPSLSLSLSLPLPFFWGGEMVFGEPRYPRPYSDSVRAGRQRNRASIPGRS
jgi:hypothetical protein